MLILTPTCGGREHDYAMFKGTDLGKVLPVQCPVFVDSGFQGMQTDYPHLIVMIPFKKPRGGDLSEVEKKFDKVIAHCRVLSEHTIAGNKTFAMCGRYFSISTGCHGRLLHGVILWPLETSFKNGLNISGIGHAYFATSLI